MDVPILICLLVACAASAQSEARESRTVQTAQGPVRGYKTDGVFQFYGIPYATAPTGSKRFTAPLPGPEWVQPFEAVNNKIICPQRTETNHSFIVQENCLIANIYMPDTEETNLPVLVYVHGGGFNSGYGARRIPLSLVKSKKIVAVTFNYRLGAHGFLCLGTEDAPGNAGMKDQVALLRWVNKNIASFGGNPENVAISGSSAGSVSVDLLMLSNMTKGLFHKVIPESGANVAVWSVQHDPVQNAKDFIRLKNFTNIDDIAALEFFYKTAPYDVLISETFLKNRTDSLSLFTPCLENNVGYETFLEDSPVNILKQGKYRKVPVLYGFTNMEGLLLINLLDDWKNKMNEKFFEFLPGDLQFESAEEKMSVAKTVKEFYFGNQTVGEETVQGYIDYFSDAWFTYPYLRSTQLQLEAGSNSIYLYEYTFYSPTASTDNLPPFAKNIRGANHCAQSKAVYNDRFSDPDDKSETYMKLRKKLREIWLNFIITGKPVPEGSSLAAWPPVGTNGSPHMEFGSEIKLKGPLREKRYRLWHNIYERYYKPPVPPTVYNKTYS